MSDKIKVKYDGRYLQAYMPNGDIIPQQTEIKIENNVGDENMALVTLQVHADISNLKDMGNPDIDYKKSADYFQGKNMELKEQLDQARKRADHYQVEYHEELNKKWYHKLFGF